MTTQTFSPGSRWCISGSSGPWAGRCGVFVEFEFSRDMNADLVALQMVPCGTRVLFAAERLQPLEEVNND